MMTEYHSNYQSPHPNDFDDRPHHQPEQQQHHQQQQQQQQQRSSNLERGRSIRLMRNGDSFYSGRGFVINQRKYPMLDVFLDDASQALRANFGAVRCIYTPKNGTRLRDISEFEDHQTYVAGGGERFKKLHYLDIAEGKRVQNRDKLPTRLPPVRRYDVEGRALKLSRSENMIIYVYRNGDPLTLPSKILLVKPTLQNWESVLDEVTRKVMLTSSAVLKLYAINGELVTSAQQLEYNGMYVAAGKERFKRIEYPDPKSFSPNSSPKMSRKSYAKSDGTNTNTTTANSHGSLEQVGHRRPVREDYDYFSSKPQQHRRGPTKEIDLDRDDGGIYKGRLNHRERAREVDETRDTKVELPVDYRDVETVEEENLYGTPGRTPRQPAQTAIHHVVANSRKLTPPMRPDHSPLSKYGRDQERSPINNDNHVNGKKMVSSNAHYDDHRPSVSPVTTGRTAHSRTEDDQDSFPLGKQQSHSIQALRLTPPLTTSNTTNKEQAATVIQSHVRGYLTRKQIHDKHQEDTDVLMDHNRHREQFRSPTPVLSTSPSAQHQTQKHHSQVLEHEVYQYDRYRSSSSASKRRGDDDDENI